MQVFAVKLFSPQIGITAGLSSELFHFPFPHLTNKIFVLFYDHGVKAQKSCPHMVIAIAGRAAEMFAGSGSFGSSFLFHKLHPVQGSGFLL